MTRQCCALCYPVQRRYAALFTTGEWTPLDRNAVRGRVRKLLAIARLAAMDAGQPQHGRQRCPAAEVAHRSGWRYFDLLAGREVPASVANDRVVLHGDLSERGLGGFVALPAAAVTGDFIALLTERAQPGTTMDRPHGIPSTASASQASNPAGNALPCRTSERYGEGQGRHI